MVSEFERYKRELAAEKHGHPGKFWFYGCDVCNPVQMEKVCPEFSYTDEQVEQIAKLMWDTHWRYIFNDWEWEDLSNKERTNFSSGVIAILDFYKEVSENGNK